MECNGCGKNSGGAHQCPKCVREAKEKKDYSPKVQAEVKAPAQAKVKKSFWERLSCFGKS